MKKALLIIITLFTITTVQAKEDANTKIWIKAKELLDKGKKEEAIVLFEKVLKKKRTEGHAAYCAFYTGQTLREHFLFKEAALYYQKATEFNDSLKDPALKGDIWNEKGLMYYDQHLYTQAMAEFSLSLKQFTTLKDLYGLEIVYNNIGILFMETKDYDKALSYYKVGLKYAEKLKGYDMMSIVLTNMGAIQYHLKEPQKALHYYDKAIAIDKKHWNSTRLANIHLNMGLCHIDLKNYDKANEFLLSALADYQQTKNTEGLFLAYINLYYVAELQNKSEKAAFYKAKALQKKYEKCGIKGRIDFYTYMKDMSLIRKNKDQALVYSLKLLELEDELIKSIQNEELLQLKEDVNYTNISSQLNETQTSLKEETKEKKKMKVLNQQLKTRNQLIILLSLTGLGLFISLFFILLKGNRRRRKTNELLAMQKKQLEEKNEEILNSMAFANSMEKLLLQQMNPHFLYNALTTIEASISMGDISFAKNYLNLFSDLLRKTLDNSRKDTITLEEEIDFLKAYITLNAVKQGPDFSYELLYNQDDVEDFVHTPPMLVQPFIENALIHGLYHKTDGPKKLEIRIEPHEDYILWTITDNGIGREKANEIGKTHKGVSHGIKITFDRIHWMKKRFGSNFSIEYIDLDKGTRVVLKTPIVE